MRYRYVGPGPQEDGDGGVVRPGDERVFDSEPLWGPWELLGDGGTESPAEPPGAWVDLPIATPSLGEDTGKGVS